MKHLLSILCLFVLSCDSGGDSNVNLEDLNGVWQPVTSCDTYTGECPSHLEDECEDILDNMTLVLDDGSWADCYEYNGVQSCDDTPQTYTISGNTLTLCEQEDLNCLNYTTYDDCSDDFDTCKWENDSCMSQNEDERCHEATIELNDNKDFFVLIFSMSQDGCTFTHNLTAEKID